MWRARYDNEALYPSNGPVHMRQRASRTRSKRTQTVKRKPVQLRMHFKWPTEE